MEQKSRGPGKGEEEYGGWGSGNQEEEEKGRVKEENKFVLQTPRYLHAAVTHTHFSSLLVSVTCPRNTLHNSSFPLHTLPSLPPPPFTTPASVNRGASARFTELVIRTKPSLSPFTVQPFRQTALTSRSAQATQK